MIEKKNHPAGGRSPDDITGEKTSFIYLLNTFKVAAIVTTENTRMAFLEPPLKLDLKALGFLTVFHRANFTGLQVLSRTKTDLHS